MAESMTYDSLKADVLRYLERGATFALDPFMAEQLPRLINLAERRIATELKVQGFIRAVNTELVPGQSVYAKPDRWRDTVSINIGVGPTNTRRKTIGTRSYEYLRAYWPDSAQTDEPLFYAEYDFNHWLIAPTPDAAYPAEIVYYELPALLDDTTQTNWITEIAPQLLLYATLLEATPFLKDDNRIPTWQAMYDRAAAMVNGEDLTKILDRAAARKEA